MGQYYLAVLLDDAGKILRWVSPRGMKLMEHAYLDDSVVNSFEYCLNPTNKYFKSRVVWAGDYADNEQDSNENLYKMCVERTDLEAVLPIESTRSFPFLVNHDKKQFVDKRKSSSMIHPLPLLTCEGNGRGGGDLDSKSPLIGSWARDHISIECAAPDNYSELIFDLSD